MLSVAANTESADYTCNKKVRVQVALFGMLVLYTISAFNESAMVVVGLRGGPLEERKRRALRYLIYLEVFLWVLILGFTSVATYVGASPEISATCWSNNPCAYISNVVPSACTADKTGDIVLTDSCAQITENADYFSVNCFDPWFNYASTVSSCVCMRVRWKQIGWGAGAHRCWGH